jgi:PTS system N-acetylglucosamine-specific IIA component
MRPVLSPVGGHTVAVGDIPDPVFARGLVGPGVAVVPRPGVQVAVSPVEGVLAKLHPHAYLVVGDGGVGLLVHLGIDTVRMQGDGFELLAREGERVLAGDQVVRWDPSLVQAAGYSPVCAVVALDCGPGTVVSRALDVEVEPGRVLFELDC